MEGDTAEWCIQYDKNKRIKNVNVGGKDEWVMYGPVYFKREFSLKMKELLIEEYHKNGTENDMWENVLINHLDELPIYINKQSSENVFEFENLDELKKIDKSYEKDTRCILIKKIASIFNENETSIKKIQLIKKGMTNRSFSFQIGLESYICRIPGVGTEKLIDRKQEYDVYEAIKDLGISDYIKFFDFKSGLKISKYYRDTRNANAMYQDDVVMCMNMIRKVHKSNVKVAYSFEFKEQISIYEQLCHGSAFTLYKDKPEMTEKIQELVCLTEKWKGNEVLCHIDCVPDNFLILSDGTIKLIDWEYAAMGRPFVDIAMFSVYAYYEEIEILELLEIYLKRKPCMEEIEELYCYVAMAGYLWSLWTQYKQNQGVKFKAYGLKMYCYAQQYYKKVIQMGEV